MTKEELFATLNSKQSTRMLRAKEKAHAFRMCMIASKKTSSTFLTYKLDDGNIRWFFMSFVFLFICEWKSLEMHLISFWRGKFHPIYFNASLHVSAEPAIWRNSINIEKIKPNLHDLCRGAARNSRRVFFFSLAIVTRYSTM